MAVAWLPREHVFPDPREADEYGIVAIGGDLNWQRVLAGYSRGIFPWPHKGMPLLWFSPEPRYVLPLGKLKIWRSLRQALRKGRLRISLDAAFAQVMAGCAKVKRAGESGSWITPPLIRCYTEMHKAGFAHSAEAWLGDELVGGLYGVSLGGMFCGESMFHTVNDASKIAFVTLCRQLTRWGFDFVDAETYTEHMARYGTEPWPRERFLQALAATLKRPTRAGTWVLDADLAIPRS